MKKQLHKLFFSLLLVVGISATTYGQQNIFYEDFSSTSGDETQIDQELTSWLNYNESGTISWYSKSYSGNKYAQMASYGTGEANTTWLITPAIDISSVTNVDFTFDVNVGYWTHDGLKVFISEDFDGTNVESATWIDSTSHFNIPSEPSGGYGTLSSAGTIDLSSYSGTVYIGFQYVGNDNNDSTTTYQIDNVAVLNGNFPTISLVSHAPENVYSTDKVGVTAQVTSDVALDTVFFAYGTASDALNDTIGMVVEAGETFIGKDSIPAMSGGTNVYYQVTAITENNDSTLSDVMDYSVKLDVVTLPYNEYIENDLGFLTTYNVTGDQKWIYDSYGDDTFAKMSGYSGGAVENEDWLISPAIDFSNVNGASMTFKEAINYGGTIADQQEVYVSTDYAGTGDPNSATWTELTVTNRASGGDWTFVFVDSIDLSPYAGEPKVYIGFKYTSTTSTAATWEIDSISVVEGAPANNAPEIANIQITPSEPTADDDVQVNATITDIDPTDNLTCKLFYGASQDAIDTEVTFSNDATGSEDVYGGLIPAQSAGEKVYFKIMATDGKDTVTTSGDYTVADDATDIDDFNNVEMKVYPNPGQGQYNLELNGMNASAYKVVVFNAIGNVVYQQVMPNNGQVRKSINLSHLSDGIYYLKVQNENVEKVVKLIKQ